MEVKMLMLFVTVCITALLTVVMQQYRHALKLHLYIYGLLWFGLLAIVPFAGPVYEILNSTYLIFCFAAVLFFLGSFFALPFFYKEPPIVLEWEEPISDYSLQRILLYLLVFLAIVANILYYRSIVSKLGNIWESIAVLRTQEGVETKLESANMFFNIFGRAYNIYLPLALFIYSKKELKLWILLASIVISFIIAAASLTRAPVLNVAIIVLVCAYLFKIKIKWRNAAIAGATIFALFYLSTKEIDKLSGEADSDFSETVGYYFLGSLKSFESLLAGHYHPSTIYDSPYYSLDFANYFAQRFALIESYPPLVREYSDPIYTNVYTYLDAFTLDWGMLGLFFCPILIGFLCGAVSCMVKRSANWVYVVIYCYCCDGIAMSFMNNEFIRSSFIIVPALAAIFYAISKKRNHPLPA